MYMYSGLLKYQELCGYIDFRESENFYLSFDRNGGAPR